MFFMTLYLQHVRDQSPVQAGATLLVFSVPFAALSPIAGKAMGPFGVRWLLLLGMILILIGSVMFALIDVGTGIGLVLAGLFSFAVGEAFAYNVSTAAAMLAIPEAKAGAASGVQNTIRQFGIIFGVAVCGALFKALENAKLLSLFDSIGAGLSAGDRDEVRNLLSGSDAAQAGLATLTPATAEQISEIVDRAFIHGLNGAMWLCAGVSVIGVALCFILQARTKTATSTAPAPARS
jgi:MFS family permease